MTECVRGTAPGRGLDHGDLGANLLKQRHQGVRRVVGCVQQHVKQRKLDLAQGLHSALEVFGCQHFVKQLTRQRRVCVCVGRHVFKHIPFPAKILHELARKLYGVPLHAADARNVALVNLGQHVVQAMAEFMKQGGHVIMGQQGGPRDAVDFNAVRKVAHQMRHRCLQLVRVGAQPAGAHIIHPRAATLASSRRRVEVELAHQCG